MSFWSWMDEGNCMVQNKTLRQRAALLWGRHLAKRHKGVNVDKSALISPDARINPRGGKINIGKSTTIAPGAAIQGCVSLGDNTSVQYHSMLIGYTAPDGENGSVVIGNNVRIAAYTVMIAANHNFSDLDKPICRQGLSYAPIRIENDVWIGSRVNIMAGVTIGTGSVIGAGAVVTHDIPPYSVAVGCPARVIKSRRAADDRREN